MSDKDDCISRRDAIEAIEKAKMAQTPDGEIFVAKYNTEMNIQLLPSVQPEPHEGHWIGGDGSYICSECNSSPMDFIETMGSSFDAYVETLMNFCPNCGAKMFWG